MSDSKGSGPESGDDLWRDIARMEAEVADPEEGETRHYQREEMKELIAKARQRIPSKSRMKAVGGGALGLPRREEASAPESPPPKSGEATPSSTEEDDDQPLPSVRDLSDDDDEDDDPTQVVPNKVAKVAAAQRKAQAAAAREAFAAKRQAAEAKRAAELKDDADVEPSRDEEPEPRAIAEEPPATSRSSFGWVLWFVVGCLLAVAFYALRG